MRQLKVSPKARSPIKSKVVQFSQVAMSITFETGESAEDEPVRSRSWLIKRFTTAWIKDSCSQSALSEKTG